MKKFVPIIAFVLASVVLTSGAYAQSNLDPTLTLSSSNVDFFNGDQGSIDVTVKNNDDKTHTFTVSVFPSTLDKVSAFANINHITLAPQETGTFKVSFSSLIEAEFVPRQFGITLASTEDPTIEASKNVFVKILRRSPVFILSLGTNKFTYLPQETLNVSYVVNNNGAETFDSYTVQTVIGKGSIILKRFESTISFLPERSSNTFSNLYTFDQFTEPGTYRVEMTLIEDSGEIVSKRTVNFNVGDVTKTSQTEKGSVGIFQSTTTITSTNEGNAPADLRITAIVPSFAEDLIVANVDPVSSEKIGSSIRLTWVFEDVPAGGSASVEYSIVIWKIWASIIAIAVVVFLAFKFVFRVHVLKKTNYGGSIKKDAEIPVSIEIVNRSLNEVKDVVVRDTIPPIANVVNKFESVKPTIHKTAKGTEVVWKFDSLRPGEERIVAYRIKPKMDLLGSLKLNPAVVNYQKKDRTKKSVASRMLTVTKKSK